MGTTRDAGGGSLSSCGGREMGRREGFQRPETLSHRGSRPRPQGTSRGDSKSKGMG